MRLILAIRVFFQILFNAAVASKIEQMLRGDAIAPTPAPAPQPVSIPAAPKPPARSDALTFLSALQREARFLDLTLEPLDGYTDAQIGAGARTVLDGCRKVIERMFGVRPLLEQPDGSPVEVPAGYDANRFLLTGKVSGQPPFSGRLTHHGWQASHCELPVWSGVAASALVIAPAEVEV